MATFTVGRHLGKIHSTCPENQRLRLCDQKIFALSVLGYIGSISAPDKATFKIEVHARQCTTADHTTLFPPTYEVFGPCAALVLTRLVFTLSASRSAPEVPRVRTRSTKAFRRSKQLESMTLLLWKRNFSAPSMDRSTAEAFQYCMLSDRNGKLDVSSQNKTQKAATTRRIT